MHRSVMMAMVTISLSAGAKVTGFVRGEAVRDAQRHDVAFIRFFARPGYPKATAAHYLKDKDDYWRETPIKTGTGSVGNCISQHNAL